MNSKSIVYIAIGAYNLVGVKSKLIGKINALRKVSENVVCYYFCNDIRQEIVEDGITYVPFYFDGELPNLWKGRFFWRFNEYYIRKQKFKIIYENLKEIENVRCIIFRYISADLNSMVFGVKYFKKVLYEHNSFELEELKLIKNQTLRNYYLKSEKIFGPFVRIFAKCLISVTDEINLYERKKSFNLTKSVTISNGIELNKFSFVNVKKYTDGDVLNVLFTSGYGNIWHGVDLLVKSISNHKNVVLHLMGEFTEEIHNLISDDNKDQFIFYGKLFGEEYESVYKKCHVAVSSLAMFRIGLKEGSILKTREYTCRGIPFILAHKDVDFEDDDITPFIYRTNVNENHLVDFEKVKTFLINIQKLNYRNMQIFAENNLSYEIKASKYKKLISELF